MYGLQEIKLKMCREHLESMSKEEFESKTGRHFLCACVIAEWGILKATSLELENRELRLQTKGSK